MFEFTDRIRFSETDEKLKLTLPALLNYFQDCSVFHSENAGITVKRMQNEHFAWVLSSWQVELHKMPSFNDEVTAGTFAYDCKGIRGMRNFYMKDSSGDFCACADTLWALIDTEELKPIKVSDEMKKAYDAGKEEKLALPDLGKHICTEGEPDSSSELSFTKYDCDMNHHVNNVRLITAALEAAEFKGKLIRLRTEFKKQILGDETVRAEIFREYKCCKVTFSDRDGKLCTVFEFTAE